MGCLVLVRESVHGPGMCTFNQSQATVVLSFGVCFGVCRLV